ncbi:hypothetical protein HDU96_003066 [Phlyctochytrium bullatum]|nr:hypothetical protein HDU96_003066 [Phlyctochytrium bullatum]
MTKSRSALYQQLAASHKEKNEFQREKIELMRERQQLKLMSLDPNSEEARQYRALKTRQALLRAELETASLEKEVQMLRQGGGSGGGVAAGGPSGVAGGVGGGVAGGGEGGVAGLDAEVVDLLPSEGEEDDNQDGQTADGADGGGIVGFAAGREVRGEQLGQIGGGEALEDEEVPLHGGRASQSHPPVAAASAMSVAALTSRSSDNVFRLEAGSSASSGHASASDSQPTYCSVTPAQPMARNSMASNSLLSAFADGAVEQENRTGYTLGYGGYPY